MPSLVCPRGRGTRSWSPVSAAGALAGGVRLATVFFTVAFAGAACFFAAGRFVALAPLAAVAVAAFLVPAVAAAFRADGDVLVVFFVVAMRREPPRRRDRTGQYSWTRGQSDPEAAPDLGFRPLEDEQPTTGESTRPT